jgi:hypothetical protein
MKNKQWYKIVDLENGKIKTLFHGLNGSRVLPTGKWLTATKKMVSDGKGTEYLSGFHIMENLNESIRYLKRFKNIQNKAVVLVSVNKVWKKEHSNSNVWLAEKIIIHKVVFQYQKPEIKGVGSLLTHYFGIDPGYYMTLSNEEVSKG